MKTLPLIFLLSLTSAAAAVPPLHLDTDMFWMTNAPPGIVGSNPPNFVLLGGSVRTNFLTNAVEHWPQVAMPTQELGRDQLLDLYSNMDNKSVEFTVTRQRLLSFDWEGKPYNVTNAETVAHFSVEYRRVRTNEWMWVGWSNDIVHTKPGMLDLRYRWGSIEALCETNWFEPVRTNKMLLASLVLTNDDGRDWSK